MSIPLPVNEMKLRKRKGRGAPEGNIPKNIIEYFDLKGNETLIFTINEAEHKVSIELKPPGLYDGIGPIVIPERKDINDPEEHDRVMRSHRTTMLAARFGKNPEDITHVDTDLLSDEEFHALDGAFQRHVDQARFTRLFKEIDLPRERAQRALERAQGPEVEGIPQDD